FKRRTKVMEIVAGEKACYNLLAFICLKMELHWRKSPMGKCCLLCSIPISYLQVNLHKILDSTLKEK
ncbi:MAG: hypothetical protein ACTSRC_20615, partial [Candidatus Helarchaeota archaeon]